MQHVTANIHVCRSFICQLSGVARLRCAACPPCVPVCRCAGARVTVCHHRPAVVSRCGDSRGDTPHHTPLHCTCTSHRGPPRWSAASAGSWPPSPASGPGSRRTRGTARWSSRDTSRGTSTLQVSDILFLLVHKIQYQVWKERMHPVLMCGVVSCQPFKVWLSRKSVVAGSRGECGEWRRGTQCNTSLATAEEGEFLRTAPIRPVLQETPGFVSAADSLPRQSSLMTSIRQTIFSSSVRRSLPLSPVT